MNRRIGCSLCLYTGGPGFTKHSQDYRQSGLLYFKFKFIKFATFQKLLYFYILSLSGVTLFSAHEKGGYNITSQCCVCVCV